MRDQLVKKERRLKKDDKEQLKGIVEVELYVRALGLIWGADHNLLGL